MIRVKKQNIEKNEINNKKLRESLLDTALSTLKQGINYNNLENTVADFGYLFMIKDHGLEALFKITTDIETYYFAAQGQSIIMLEFNEELFKSTTETFLSFHG